MDHHACGLVDDGKMIVFVENVERNVLGKGMQRWRMRSAFDLDGLAALELELRLGGLTVDANLTVLDQQLNTGTADVRNRLSEVLVQAQAGGLGRRR